MSRRPRAEAIGSLQRSTSRMAPGGRRWSESPIPRSVPRRKPRGVGSAAWSVVLRPDWVDLTPGFPGAGNPGTLIGGGGNATLNDDSDSTYIDLDSISAEGAIFGFESTDLPPLAVITSGYVSLRLRKTDDYSGDEPWLGTSVAYDHLPTGTQDPTYLIANGLSLSTSWATVDSPQLSELPSVAVVEAGEVQMLVRAPGATSFEHVHISEAWLYLSGTYA